MADPLPIYPGGLPLGPVPANFPTINLTPIGQDILSYAPNPPPPGPAPLNLGLAPGSFPALPAPTPEQIAQANQLLSNTSPTPRPIPQSQPIGSETGGIGPWATSVPAPIQIPTQPGQAPQVPDRSNRHTSQSTFGDLEQKIIKSQADQKAALGELKTTQQAGAERTRDAQTDAWLLAQEQAEELRQKQELNTVALKKLEEQDRANLDRAKNYQIPNFWGSGQGKFVGASIAAALSGAQAGLLGQTGNSALQLIQHNIDQYIRDQKEKVDNLFKYAEAQGRVNDKVRMQYAQDLLNLKDQHSYLLSAAAERAKAVAAYAKGAADSAQTEVLISQLGEQGIKDRMEVRRLRGQLNLMGAQAEQASAAASEHRARAAQGGYLTPAQQIQEARLVLTEMTKDLNAARKDIFEPLQHADRALSLVKKDPNDPLNWVHLVDSMIRSNTGRAAIMSQYNLFMGHAAGAMDTPEQVLEHFKTNKPSPAQQKAIMDSAMGVYNGLREESKKKYDTFRNYDTDSRIQTNRIAKEGYNRLESNYFGTLPGYGQPETSTQPDPFADAKAWIAANPNDPRVPAIKAKIGMK